MRILFQIAIFRFKKVKRLKHKELIMEDFYEKQF